MKTTRRQFVIAAATAVAGGAVARWRRALAQPAATADSPYGPLGPPDEHGLCVPAAFRARLIARTGERVAGTGYVWHAAPDGGACFRAADTRGGWIYVSNSELGAGQGGVGAIRFDGAGRLVDAYRILSGTRRNCAGGPTPWGTWLSCEEVADGQVWECRPQSAGQGVVRPALGRFRHEAAAVDPVTGCVYLTEDDRQGRLYRFTPQRPGDLSTGRLHAGSVRANGIVHWIEVDADVPDRGPDTTPFLRGEGAWFADGHLFFSTTSDHGVWVLQPAAGRIERLYDAAVDGGDGVQLRDPDNLTVHPASGDLYVAEDEGNLRLVLLADRAGRRIDAPFLSLVGHDESEVAGPAFSPDGTRLYVSSQRGMDDRLGMTFEIRGPFRRT